MKHYKYSSIDQFRNAIKAIRLMSSYVGQDENDEPVYEQPVAYPIIDFSGTVKLHGSNAGVVYENGTVYAQSRKNVITPDDDNYGVALFVEENKDKFLSWFESFDIKYGKYVAFGEWCGGNIQKGVGITGLPKMFVVFDIRAVNDDGETVVKFHSELAELCDIENVHAVSKFAEYSLSIDFNSPELAQNLLIEQTNEVEAECPAAKYFGVNGIGEGVVWVGEYKNKTIRFKVKGEKHSVTKVKVLAEVDVVKLNSVNEYVERTVTENRVRQAVGECKADSRASTGDVIRWVFNDVVKEESDVLKESGLTKNDIGKAISTKAKSLFFSILDEDAGL